VRGDLKSNNATFQQEIFESAQGVLEKEYGGICDSLNLPYPLFSKEGSKSRKV